MKYFNLHIPPPILFFLCGIYVFAVRNVEPILPFGETSRFVVALILMLIGIGFYHLGVSLFMKFKNELNPMMPKFISDDDVLITSGIYKYTRNPIYIGMTFALLSWCVINLSCFGFLVVPVFIKYIDTFQIKPEEDLLRAKFSQEYDDYCHRVRRWF